MSALAISYSKSEQQNTTAYSFQRTFIFPRHIAKIKVRYSSRVPEHSRIKITQSEDAADVLRAKWDEGKIEHVEEFKTILLNRANQVLGVADISSGGVSGCTADPKLIYQIALVSNASGVIISHNHPSGNLKPSQADIDLTRKLKEGGKFLDCPVLDHVILTKSSYYSFADNGIL